MLIFYILTFFYKLATDGCFLFRNFKEGFISDCYFGITFMWSFCLEAVSQ